MIELLFLVVVGLAVWKLVENDRDRIDDPLDLACSSVERLQAEAERALEELRQLDRNDEGR